MDEDANGVIEETGSVENGIADHDGSGAEKKVLDKIGEALARLGRVKRVGLGVREKMGFVRAWTRKRR